MAAAKDCVTATQAPDVKAMDDSQRKIIECATGDFGAQANLYSGLLVDAYQTVKAAGEGLRHARGRREAQRRRLDRRAGGHPGGDVQLGATRIRSRATDCGCKMMPDGGTYKIDNIDPVSK